MSDKITLYRADYTTYYAYRKAIKEYRDAQFFVARIFGGVICFRFFNDYQIWKNAR